MAWTRVCVPSITFAGHFLYPYKLSDTRCCKHPPSAFSKRLWCKTHSLMREGGDVFLLVTSTHTKIFWLELCEGTTWFLASSSSITLPLGRVGRGAEGAHCNLVPTSGPAAKLAAGNPGWGCLGHPLCGVCNMRLLTVFGLLSVGAFIVPILLPL